VGDGHRHGPVQRAFRNPAQQADIGQGRLNSERTVFRNKPAELRRQRRHCGKRAVETFQPAGKRSAVNRLDAGRVNHRMPVLFSHHALQVLSLASVFERHDGVI
jgi:hypothetical protein